MPDLHFHTRAINTIRFLAADAVQAANSGHPGLPMGAAAMTYTLWTRHLRFDPKAPDWPNRDRFLLSAGHGSMLLYALLHLTGYDLPLQELKDFRQWGSMTPGHPEYGEAPGVEVTTGPLGQGFANGVGMGIAAEHMAALYNRDGLNLVDHNIYALVSDGDLMEGVSHEAASLAGHLQLGRLIYLYDDNRITIDGSTELTFTENRGDRFRAYGWHVLTIENGNDLEAVDEALGVAKQDPRPSLIVTRTHIGYGLPTKQDTAAAHGEPPGEAELEGAKKKLGWPVEPRFLIPEDVSEYLMEVGRRGTSRHEEWKRQVARYREAYPELAAQYERTLAGDLPQDLAELIPTFGPSEKGMATRVASGKTLNTLAPALPELIGGSADLTGSNKTDIKGEAPFSAHDRNARYVHFGVREHGMGSILNGIARYGGLIPYGGTFLVFTDYLRPSVRLAALMGLRVIYVLTHDSIGLGEDGPTHQPIEHLASLRAIPNLTVIRPADANETAVAWLVALQRRAGPTALVLTRQAIPTFDRSEFASPWGLMMGGYTLADLGTGELDLVLLASGSEVQLIVEAGKRLAELDLSVRLVSFPSWELFKGQPEAYQSEVLPPGVPARVGVEAATPLGWQGWVGDAGVALGIERFGASAPYEEIYRNFGLTADGIVAAAMQVLEKLKVEEAKK